MMNDLALKLWMKNFSLALLATLTVSCKTSGDLIAEKMNQDPAEVKTITTANQKPQVQPRSQPVQQNVNEDLAREVEVLKGQLQEKEYLSQQEKAQIEARLQAAEQEKARLMQEIQILKGAAPTAAAAQGGDLLYEAARKDIQAKKYSQAVANLKDFLENFPNDPRVEQALMLKGQSEYAAEQFKPSLVTFSNYLDKYPKGKERSMAWLGQGAALLRLKKKNDAKLFLEQCVSLFPKSKEAKVAKKLLKTPTAVPTALFI
jgi:TolA-binding protein